MVVSHISRWWPAGRFVLRPDDSLSCAYAGSYSPTIVKYIGPTPSCQGFGDVEKGQAPVIAGGLSHATKTDWR